ncbi:MAG: MFS transporter [Gemmatimonadales bacterium]
MAASRDGLPVKASLLLAAGTFVVGAVAPLYDTYVPALLERHLGRSAWVGAAMGIDNLLALLLVPVVGALSDGARFRGGRRVPFVLAALPFVVIGLALLPAAERVGLVALLGAMILLDAALAVWRAPFSALLAELIPSGQRSKTEGIQGVARCLGAMVVSALSAPGRRVRIGRSSAAALAGVVWLIHRLAPGAVLRTSARCRSHNPLASLRAAFAAGGASRPDTLRGLPPLSHGVPVVLELVHPAWFGPVPHLAADVSIGLPLRSRSRRWSTFSRPSWLGAVLRMAGGTRRDRWMR